MTEVPRIPTLEISEDASLPFYRRIADALCQGVLSGQIKPGERLPTRQTLAKALGTSPVTVGRGYEWLQGRGLVDQKRRSGTRLRIDALAILDAITEPQPKAGSTSSNNGYFNQLVVVLGESDLTCLHRDHLEIVSQIITGVSDVLGDRAGQFHYIKAFDRESLKDLPQNSAVLVWGKQTPGTYDAPFLPALMHELAQREIPVLGLWSHDQMSGLPQIQYTPYQAVNLACRHLLDCGYRRLGYIGDMGQDLAPKFYEFTNVLFKAGLDFQFSHVREVNQEPGAAYQAALDIARNDLPDAFFVDVDWKAMEVVAALNHAGFNVPSDVAVVGFGDIPDVQDFKPGLTTVRLPRREIGQEAGRQLLAWATDRTPLHSVLLDAKLVVRQTTTTAELAAVSTSESSISSIE